MSCKYVCDLGHMRGCGRLLNLALLLPPKGLHHAETMHASESEADLELTQLFLQSL